MKRLWIVLMGLLPFGLYAKEMKVPFSIPVDFSKKGTVYETDFQAPWNILGSEVRFELAIGYFLGYTKLTEEQGLTEYAIDKGMKNNIPIPKEEQQSFKLKVTLTPLGWASNDVTIWSGASWFPEMTKKEYQGEKIEFVAIVPLYGGDYDGGKNIMIADLQRLRNYHIQIESLENVELPIGVKTAFRIRKHSRKV